MEPSNSELLEATKTDIDAFAVFYDRMAEPLLAYFMKRTACPQTSADLCAETFASALASVHRFRRSSAPGEAWLYKIASRQLARFHRRRAVDDRARRRLGISPLAMTEEDLDRIEAIVDAVSMRSQISEAMASLPGGQRSAVELRIARDLSYSEVATLLGCSEGAARVRVSRGLKDLAIKLEDHS